MRPNPTYKSTRSSSLLQYVPKQGNVRPSCSSSKSAIQLILQYTAVISRQFREMTKARIESLLASFPRLIPANSQHTSVETSEVRYVYQPLEDLYILVITNKASNILQDIDTLHLFARVVADMCRAPEEAEILKNAFELLGAFDEIVSLGYREQVTLMQVRSILEMESHEEKIQDIIARVRNINPTYKFTRYLPKRIEQRSRGERRTQTTCQATRNATKRTTTPSRWRSHQ